MISIHLDGQRLEVDPNSILRSVLQKIPPGNCVAVIRPTTKEQAKTNSLAITTTAGEITIDLDGEKGTFLEKPGFSSFLSLHWEDRYAALLVLSNQLYNRRVNQACMREGM